MTGQDIYGFTLFHVYFEGFKRDGIVEPDYLIAYNGKKAPGLDYLIQKGYRGKIFMDSGAFSAARKNTDIDIDGYIAYVNQVGDHLDAIAQLDYIPRIQDGTPEQRQEKSSRLTWERFLYMWDRIRPELRRKLVYIVHAEDAETLLTRALEWRDKDGNKIEFMALGLASGTAEWKAHQLSIATRLFTKYNYTGRFHGLGLQTLDLIKRCPFLTSCDSSSAIKDQMTGKIFIGGDQVKISDDTKVHHKSEMSDAHKQLLVPTLKARAEQMGIDFELAKTDAKERYLWNCRERDDYIKKNFANHTVIKRGNLIRRS